MNNKKIIFHVTRQYMKRNKGRTAVTFTGIALMVMLMTCVFVGKDTDLAAKLTGKLFGVDFVAVLIYDVHHVQRDDHRNAKLGKLGGKVKIAFKVGAVDDVEYRVGTLGDEIISRHHFLQRIGRKRINTRQVHDHNVVVLFELALFLFDGNAGPVADELIGACQGIEERRFAAVRVARKCYFDCHFYVILSFLAVSGQ